MSDAILGDRYRIIQKLGEGSMGEVYLAEHRALGRREAVKVLRPDFAGDPEFVSRFRREARATHRVQHPNIVMVYDFGRLDDGRFYLAMEYADGTPVDELLRVQGRLPPARAVHILVQLADAIDHAHAHGVLHRDLKPANLMLLERRSRPDLLKVLDFGIAKIISPEYLDSVAQTRTGAVFGTPGYLAPERIRGEEPDPRSDLYSVGCIAYELLTGAPVFSGPAVQILNAHLTAPPLRPSERAPAGSISAGLDEVVLRLLAKSPDERFDSAGALRAALTPIAAAAEVDAPPARRSLRTIPQLVDFDAEETQADGGGIGAAPTVEAGSEELQAAYWQLIVEAGEELLNAGYEDVHLVVQIAEVKQLHAQLAAHAVELDEADRALGDIEQSAREQEATLRFALGELRFQRDDAGARNEPAPPDLDVQVGEIERRLRDVGAERDGKVRDLTDRAVAITAAQARVEEQLVPAARRLEEIIEAAIANSAELPRREEIAGRLEQAQRARGGSGRDTVITFAR